MIFVDMFLHQHIRGSYLYFIKFYVIFVYFIIFDDVKLTFLIFHFRKMTQKVGFMISMNFQFDAVSFCLITVESFLTLCYFAVLKLKKKCFILKTHFNLFTSTQF